MFCYWSRRIVCKINYKTYKSAIPCFFLHETSRKKQKRRQRNNREKKKNQTLSAAGNEEIKQKLKYKSENALSLVVRSSEKANLCKIALPAIGAKKKGSMKLCDRLVFSRRCANLKSIPIFTRNALWDFYRPCKNCPDVLSLKNRCTEEKLVGMVF